MKSVKSNRIKSIALFIVLMALVTAYYKNGFQKETVAFDTREAVRFFEDQNHFKKVSIDLNLKSIDQMRSLISTKLEPNGAAKLYSSEQGNNAVYIYQIEAQNLQPALQNISEIGSISNHKEKNSAQNTYLDLDTKLREKETIYQKEFKDYNDPKKPNYSYQLDRLKTLRAEIDSLKFDISNQKDRAMTLLYIRAQATAHKAGVITNYKIFFISFVKYLIGFSILVICLYYGTMLLMYLLSQLGIKFPSLNSYGRGYNDYAGYKGNRGYGGYGYGGSRKRRVKRIYRNKQGSSEETEDNEK